MSNRKTKQLAVRMYEHELARLREEAAGCGVSFSDYVRYRLGCQPRRMPALANKDLGAATKVKRR